LWILEQSLQDLLAKSPNYKNFFDLVKFDCGLLTGIMYLIHNVMGFISLVKFEYEALKDDEN